ncbi:quinate utilization oxidoreductase [Colletotrichum truncatum]|uniref:Quinate utilization oxidoreductase n=1 Tax=Colletotrichum truncatum TaxID=5467 RepID=A0ACC3YFP0_COLTU|nr:quinate utilization oxidoreductase [Colletotrichum truncatum]KAF6788386.1 quinate utilization oxidoreductase [Colletotrichum truncatum]
MSSQASKVRFAVIGAGLIGPRHARTVAQSADAILVAIVDPAPSGHDLASELNVAHYASVDELLQSPDSPEAAIVCTPNHTHVQVSKRLSSSGVHVLVEKPVSSDIATGLELVEHLRTAGVKALVGHHRRFNPVIESVAKTLSEESLGKVIAINGVWTLYKPSEYFEAPTAWRQGKDGGVILINMIHEVDILHYLLGPIVRVYAEKTMSERGHEAEEGAALTLRFKSGVVGTFLISDNVPSPYNFEAGTGENPLIPKTGQPFYTIFGTNGTLSVPDMGIWSYRDTKKSWHSTMTRDEKPCSDEVPFEQQLRHFCRVIRQDELPRCSVQAGLAALVVCQAIKESLETNTPVDIDNYEL